MLLDISKTSATDLSSLKNVWQIFLSQKLQLSTWLAKTSDLLISHCKLQIAPSVKVCKTHAIASNIDSVSEKCVINVSAFSQMQIHQTYWSTTVTNLNTIYHVSLFIWTTHLNVHLYLYVKGTVSSFTWSLLAI